MSGLRIAPGLELPVDVAGESTAILAKKGAGKSNTAKVIVEETLDHGGIQVVVLDPIGHWWSLRAGADGKQKGGYPVAVFGGMHGDLPLEETAGKLLAQTAVESGQSLVLDVSSLESNGAMQRFVYELLEELYRLKQAAPSPLLLVLEEADEFAPQDPKGKNVPRMVGAANRISKRGRGRGIGMLYVTQRSAALNKNVLDQADTLIVMRTIGPRDRAAIEGWVKHQDAQGMDEILPSLPSLATGEAWVWTPERQLLERVQIRKARTYDSSWTPRAGDAKVIVDVKPIDVDALGHAIAATVERAKANDPDELRRRIRLLEATIAPASEKVVEVERVVEVPMLSPVEKGRIENLERKLDQLAGALDPAVLAMRDAQQLLVEIRNRTKESLHAEAPTPSARAPRPLPELPRVRDDQRGRRDDAPARQTVPGSRAASGEGNDAQVDGALSLGASRLLTVLAQFPGGRTRKQLGVLAGYKASGSSFRGAIAELRARGYASPASVDPIVATPEGTAAAPADALPTGRALHDYWVQRLPEGARRLLELLYERWPDGFERDELATLAGYEPKGSSYRGAIAALRNVDLATPAGVDPIKASDELMEGA